jgi:hypothetical protein
MARENSELELQARKEGRGSRTHGERGRSYPLRSSKAEDLAGQGQRRAAQGSRTKYPRWPSQCSGSLLLSEAGRRRSQVQSTVYHSTGDQSAG